MGTSLHPPLVVFGRSNPPFAAPFFLPVIFSLAQVSGAVRNPQDNSRGRIGLVLQVSVLMTLFVVLMPIIGFFLSAVILLVGGIYAMGYRRHLTVGLLTVGMLLFCWFVFVKTLGLPLPSGNLFG